jgi:hypothetical protein
MIILNLFIFLSRIVFFRIEKNFKINIFFFCLEKINNNFFFF